MKRVILILPFLFSIIYAQSVWYAAAKSGLNLREKPDPQSKVIKLIPYGSKLYAWMDISPVAFSIENFNGNWWNAEFEGLNGFVFSEYLSRIEPPKETEKDFESYIRSFPLSNSGTENNIVHKENLYNHSTSSYVTTTGILYYTSSSNEYRAFVCMIPSMTIYQSFNLLRIFPTINKVLGKDDDFPIKSTTIPINYDETFTIKPILYESWVTGVVLRWESDGYPEQIKITKVGDEVLVIIESGTV